MNMFGVPKYTVNKGVVGKRWGENDEWVPRVGSLDEGEK
jgi:hypothetical protein